MNVATGTLVFKGSILVITLNRYICVCVFFIYMSGKVDKPDTDNRFSNDISSLFKKDFFRMTSFSKVQHWRKTRHSEEFFKDEISLLNLLSVPGLSSFHLFFSHVRFTKIYHFPICVSVCLLVYIYIYIYIYMSVCVC